MVGSGYQAGGRWFYPREDFQYDQTGLATVAGTRSGATADGEPASAAGLTAAHQTLQLPAIARVTNLETGLQTLVRINDRGPASAHRMIALSPRAAKLLGVNGTARVRIQVDEGRSLALRAELGGGPRLAMVAVPRDKVTAENLPLPAGMTQPAAPKRNARPALETTDSAKATEQAAPDTLPETAQTVAPRPGRLMIEAGSFGQVVYARQAEARLAGLTARVDRSSDGRNERYTVRAGPYDSVAAADAALDQAFRAGVVDARIVVQ